MSNVIGLSSFNEAGLEKSSAQAASDATACALARRSPPSDSVSSSHSSPRAVTRGESPISCGDQVIDDSRESVFSGDGKEGFGLLQVRTRRRGSVRVNLSVPGVMDDVLYALAKLTGSSKASFVMEALHAHLPKLQRRLAEHNKLPHPQPRKISRPPKASPEPLHFLHAPLTRQQRRKLERDQKKAASRGGGRE